MNSLVPFNGGGPTTNDKPGRSVSDNQLIPHRAHPNPSSLVIPPYTPPITPVKGQQQQYSPAQYQHQHYGYSPATLGPTFIIQHMPSPITPSTTTTTTSSTSSSLPTADTTNAKPWWLHPTALLLFTLLASSIALTLHQFSPLIHSSASAVHNVGQVFGATAHVGNSLGDSIGLTTRVGRGVMGAVGDVWCFTVGGTGCPGFDKEKSLPLLKKRAAQAQANANAKGKKASKGEGNAPPPGAKDDDEHRPPYFRTILSGEMALTTMRELGGVAHNVRASSHVNEMTYQIKATPLLNTFSGKWWRALESLGDGYSNVGQAREDSSKSVWFAVDSIRSQYRQAKKIASSRATPFYRPFLASSLRTSSLTHELHDLIHTTLSLTSTSQTSLDALVQLTQTILDDTRDVLSEARVKVDELEGEFYWRKTSFCTNPLVRPISWPWAGRNGWCDLWTISQAIERVRELVWRVEVGKMEAIKTQRLAVRMSDDLTKWVHAFNATATVERDQTQPGTGGATIKLKADAWVIMRRLEAGMEALLRNMASGLGMIAQASDDNDLYGSGKATTSSDDMY